MSQAWAVADDFDTRLEGESSSKAYANLAMAIANTPEDTPITMSDLQSQVILKGDPGEAATIAVGTVTTLPAGSDATVTNVGTSEAAVFNFGIPKGEDGGGVTEEELATKQNKIITGNVNIPTGWSLVDSPSEGLFYSKIVFTNSAINASSTVWVNPYPSKQFMDAWAENGVYLFGTTYDGRLAFRAKKEPKTFINVAYAVINK